MDLWVDGDYYLTSQVGRIASYHKGKTTKAAYDIVFSGDKAASEVEDTSHITLPADANEITVWVRFSCSSILPSNLEYYANKRIGYWPKNGYPIYNPLAFVEGKVEIGDQGCTEWATGEWTLTWSELRAALYYSRILHLSPGYFSAWYHNCTDEAVAAGEAAGVETIDASSNPTMPLTLFLYLCNH